MNKFKLLFLILKLILLLIFLIPSSLSAKDGDAGQPGEFLRYGVGVRSLALGRAFVGLADDASAIYYNPAGLMGIERSEFYGMRFRLFDQSQYTYVALAFPRVNQSQEKIWKYLFGPDASWGFAWVNLNTEDFERRDAENRKIGDFSIYQRAFFIGFARELCGTWGILDYGTNFKLINQGLSDSDPHWGWGMDLGVKIQFINPPLIKEIVSLRYLLPLRLGMSLQNIIPPEVRLENATERYQPLLKVGGSYRVDLKDNIRLLLVSDLDWLMDTKRDMGIYSGVELQYPYKGYQIFPRIGYNNQAKRVTFGIGLKSKIINNLELQFDYAYGIHEDLMDDHRISISMNFGRLFDANYFYKTENSSSKEMKKHLQVVARYPNEKVEDSADSLAKVYDKPNAKRYLELAGGVSWANWLFKDAKSFLKEDKSRKAKSKAEEAIEEYKVSQNEEFENTDYLNYAEAYMIVAQCDTTVADNWDKAATIMVKVKKSSLRLHYQRGICHKNLKELKDAIKEFGNAIEIEPEKDKNSMRMLSLLCLGDCLIENGQHEDAIKACERITEGFNVTLDEDYPRYPPYKDKNIADDAQYLIGECCEKKGEIKEALAEYAKVCRFYPNKDRSVEAEQKLNELIKSK